MIEIEIEKYCKRVEDKVNEIHQGLAPEPHSPARFKKKTEDPLL